MTRHRGFCSRHFCSTEILEMITFGLEKPYIMDNKLEKAMQQGPTEQEALERPAPTNTMNCVVDLHIIALFQQGVKHVKNG